MFWKQQLRHQGGFPRLVAVVGEGCAGCLASSPSAMAMAADIWPKLHSKGLLNNWHLVTRMGSFQQMSFFSNFMVVADGSFRVLQKKPLVLHQFISKLNLNCVNSTTAIWFSTCEENGKRKADSRLPCRHHAKPCYKIQERNNQRVSVTKVWGHALIMLCEFLSLEAV